MQSCREGYGYQKSDITSRMFCTYGKVCLNITEPLIHLFRMQLWKLSALSAEAGVQNAF